MGGGLMQLVAYGAQDIYLTGNPQITFFKVVYRRHTNFSMEAIEQTWNGTSEGTNGRCTSTISRNGDLVHKMYLEVSGKTSSCNPGVSWIKTVELEIGGQKIDKHSGVWMETWAELTQKNPDYRSGTVTGEAFNARNDPWHRFRGPTPFQNLAGYGGVSRSCVDLQDRDVNYYVPLQFWFCRNVGLALPLIALQYHEVKVILEHEIKSIFGTGSKNKLYADYIYLDTDERRRFAQVSHEYLIEQVQEHQLLDQSTNNLNFNHPVKELIWTSYTDGCEKSTFDDAEKQFWADEGVHGYKKDGLRLKSLFNNEFLNYMPRNQGEEIQNKMNAAGKLNSEYSLLLNGHKRFSSRPSTYFSRTQVIEHHTGPGGINLWEAIATNAADDWSAGWFCDQEERAKAVPSYSQDYRLGFPYTNVAHPVRSDDTSETTFTGHCTYKAACGEGLSDAICVYSFALKPEEHQPSGTCNFSRIDNAQLVSDSAFLLGDLRYTNDETTHNYTAVIFAVNYNVLRIMSGMGGLAYSN